MNFRLGFALPTLLSLTAITALAQSISPVPGSADTTIIIATAPAKAGNIITLKRTSVKGSCLQSGTAVLLVAFTNNSVLAGAKTALILPPGTLAEGDILCAVMTDAKTKAETAKTPEVVVQSLPAVIPVIDPVPTSADTSIRLTTAPAKAGDLITLKISEVAGNCADSGTEIPLLEFTTDSVLAGEKTTVTVKPGSLTAGKFLCTVFSDAKTKAKVASTAEVTVLKPVEAVIDPAPASTDTVVDITTAPAKAGDAISLKTSETKGQCASAGKEVSLVEYTGNTVLAQEKTALSIQSRSLTEGEYLCAVMTDAKTGAITAKTPEVLIGKSAAVAAAAISPVPTNSDTTVTITTAPAKKDDTITLKTAKDANTCIDKGDPVTLLANTSNLVLAGEKTTVELQKDSLSAGEYLCAEMADPKTKEITAKTAEVVVGKASTAVLAAPTISPVPVGNDSTITLNTANAAVGQIITIQKVDPTKPSVSCDKLTAPLGLDETGGAQVKDGGTTKVHLQNPLASGDRVCAVISDSKTKAVSATTPEVTVTGCKNPGKYSDCIFYYYLIGGVEQADLSAQSSVTEGFYDLFLRRPVDSLNGNIWFRSRYLGTSSSSSTQNVVAAASNPSGAITTGTLPQSVTAVDYMLGMQLDKLTFGLGKEDGTRSMTASWIVGVGAATPLSSSTAVTGYKVPDFGTNECTQLQLRFGPTNHNGYSPALPASGPLTPNYGVGAPPANLCSVQPNPQSTTANPLAGTQIQYIAFSNEDRSSFLVKWEAGVRIVDRWFPDNTGGCASSTGCSRLMADFTIGQDQALTGGYLQKFVLKADSIIPIFNTGAYFFASSANRLVHNTNQPPLILSPVTIGTANGTTACTTSGTTVCIPAGNVFVLPYKQQNRDYYRIGIGVDLITVFKGLINLVPAKTAQ
ncbi:MAG: hypothetical protein WAN35_06955 [Terracidiphilus sp.]